MGSRQKIWFLFDKCFTHWFRFHQARSLLLSCAPYKERIWITGHWDVAKIHEAFSEFYRLLHFYSLIHHYTTLYNYQTAIIVSYGRGTQLHLGMYYGLTCTLQFHVYCAIVWISPIKLLHLDFNSGVTGSRLYRFLGILNWDLVFINLDLDYIHECLKCIINI
jgi:hypothetical protein